MGRSLVLSSKHLVEEPTRALMPRRVEDFAWRRMFDDRSASCGKQGVSGAPTCGIDWFAAIAKMNQWRIY
jgi:hypothetical protein